MISSGRQNTLPANAPINDHRNISLVKERVKLRLSFARAAMRVIYASGDARGGGGLGPLSYARSATTIRPCGGVRRALLRLRLSHCLHRDAQTVARRND